MASSSERLWMTLTVAAGTLVVTGLVLSAPAVQRCSGAADGIWSCLRQQVIDYGLLPADAPGPAVTIADQAEQPAAPPVTAIEPLPEPPQQTAAAPETLAPPAPDSAPAVAPSVATDVGPVADADARQQETPDAASGLPQTQTVIEIETEPASPAQSRESLADPASRPAAPPGPAVGPLPEPPLQVATAPETVAPQGAENILTSAPGIAPATEPEAGVPAAPAAAPPQPAGALLEPAPAATPAPPTLPPVVTATAEATRSASAALRTGFDLAAPLLRLTAQPTSGIGATLLAGLSLAPLAAPPEPPARPALTPLADPDARTPADMAVPSTSALPDIPDTSPAPAAPLAPAVDPLRPATGPLRPIPLAPAAAPVAEPQSTSDAAPGPAPAPAPGPIPSPFLDPAPPATALPPAPRIVAGASLGTAPGARAEFTPTIDAVEIEGTVNRIAGSGPEGARIDLYVGERYIDSATVEGGRWLVEAQTALRLPGQRLQVSLAGGVAAGSGVDVDFNLAPPGVRLVGKATADATLGQALQVESELEPGAAALQPLAAVSPELLRFQSGKAIVRRGDTLWAIARRVYGRGILYGRIVEANREQIRRPGRIYPGQVFDLPATP